MLNRVDRITKINQSNLTQALIEMNSFDALYRFHLTSSETRIFIFRA